MARLPQPGSDNGTWGDILNEFLSQSLASSGELKPDSVGSTQLQDNSVTASVLAPNSVTNSAIAPNSITNAELASNAVNAAIIADGSITEVLLDTSLQAKVNQTAPVSSVNGKTGVVSLSTSDVSDTTDKRYVTDVQRTVLGNTSGTNTGDQDLSGYVTQTGSETLTNKTISGAIITDTSVMPSGASLIAYNTTDQTTNYERVKQLWNNNAYTIATETGGTGTSRSIHINGAASYITLAGTGVTIGRSTTSASNIVTAQAALNGTSGVQNLLSVTPTINQSGSAGYTALKINPTETTTGSGTKLLADFQVGGTSKTRIDNTGTYYLSSGASVISYNTSDETTNYERGRIYWNSNVLTMSADAGGTGGTRNLEVSSGGSKLLLSTVNTTKVSLIGSSSSASGVQVSVLGTLSASSGTAAGLAINSTINQSGTGGYTALLINPTETATGSGSKLLIDAQVGGSTKFRVDSAGVVTAAAGTAAGSVVTVDGAQTLTNKTLDGINFSNNMTLGQGAALLSFNTSDQITNYERARQYWSGNTYTIITESGGTGISRNMQIQAGSTAISLQGSGGVQVFRNNTGINYLLNVTSTGLTASSATQYGLTINPTINQSGTAGYTALLVNPSEAATGSGAKRLVDVQAGGSSKFYIQSDGGVVFQGAGDNAFNIANTITQTAAGAVIGVGVTSNVNPASTSSAEVRAFNMSSQISNAQTHGTVRGGFLETRFMGSGSADMLTGARSQVVLPANSQNFGTITTAMGIEVAGLVESASTALTAGTVTNVVGMRAITNYKSSPGMTVTNVYGIDVQSQTIGSFNVGVRIAKSNTYSLWMSDTGGTAAGGITFGTDTNLYRSAAGVLKSDNKIEVGDYALTTPAFHAKAGASGNPIFQISRGTGTTQQFAWDMNIAGGGFGLRDAVTGYQGLNLYAASNGGAEIYVGQKGSQANYSTMSALLSASTHSAPVGSDVGGPKLTIQGGGGTGVGTPGDIEFKTFSTTAAGANVQSSTVRATIKATTGEMTIANPGTGTGSVVAVDGTQTLTNKRISPRVVTVTAGATPAINTDNGDVFIITGLTVAITSMTSGLTGTPVDGQRIRISITGTAARAIAWGTSFEASTIALPTTTVSTNRLDTDFIWNAATSKWRVATEISGTVYVSGGTDVSVADGGTGRSTSTTAYGIIAAGTTATGAQQTIAPGAAGQFLKSAGTAALGSFASITGADVSALPYDVSFMHTVGTRATGYGTNTMGTRLPRNCTFTSVTFRCGTADASGNLVVELRKNGVTVTGTSTTIAAASQISGGTSTGSWSFAAGDILTVYVSGIGTAPGNGLIADITGVTA